MITPTILYEDNHIIVAVKPAGVLSQAGELDLPDMLTLLKAYIKEKYSKPGNVFCGLVHRLDLNVGGIMVFARTSKAASRLSTQMANQQFHKNYYAVVQSMVPVGKEETLQDYLYKDEFTRTAMLSTKELGKEALLMYRSIANATYQNNLISLLSIQLETGRFHQIRLQLASRGMPIYADGKYGLKHQGDREIGLYANQLTFSHPISQELMVFSSIPQTSVFCAFPVEVFL
ncbi:MAG: RluA family pseudouridine synthase [Candidatus Izemoplasmatales bacterium]|jgi:23S rRNA pseudouridine1911/1915/1917 synthase|nr:RluA family pseudouridine synthase [bacterium]MDZ4196347.1 RluA family pseudouridine synthase [Candidatus Izemoplasmatales bacterium]